MMCQPNQKTELAAVDRIATDWLVRLANDELSEEDMSEFAEWMVSDPTHAKAFAEAEDYIASLSELVRRPPQANATANPDKNRPAGRQNNRVALFRKLQLIKKTWLAAPLAFAAIWFFAVNLVLPQQLQWFDAYFSDYSTGTGELREVILSDGSRLLMNTNSAVSVDFKGPLRRISLHHGEVRFSVASETDRPFEVLTDNLRIRALGTVFDVRHTAKDAVNITVEEHAVSVAKLSDANQQSISGNERVILQGQHLLFDHQDKLPTPVTINLERATDWQRRLLTIDNQPLSTLITELERYRNGRIFLNDPSLKNLRFSGIFPLDNPDEALESLQKVLGLRQTRISDWWIILHR